MCLSLQGRERSLRQGPTPVNLAGGLAIGLLAGRVARLDVPSTRAVMFSAATRNSLVALPLALALPDSLSIAPLAVVTQTLVELVAMIVLVRLVPRIARQSAQVPAT